MPTKSELDFHELPPLENDDLPDPQPNYDDLLDPLCDDREDPKRLDDSTGEDDPFGDLLDVPAEESGLLDDNDDAQDFDSACPDTSLVFAEAPSVAEPDEVLAEPDPLDIDFDEELGLDEGQEGPIGEDEELREEDLPALDADDQIGFDDPEGELLPADDGLPAPRAACMWSPAGAPLDVGPVRALVVLGRSVVVAGRSLFRVDLEGACESLDALGLVGSVRQLVAHGPWLVALTDRSELYVSKDAGATFEPRAEQVLHVASGTALYALFRGGELRRSDNGGDSWTAVRVPPVVAVTSACPGVIALEGLPSGVRAILRVEPRAGRSLCVELTDLGTPRLLTARADAIACAGLGGAVRTLDGLRWFTLPDLRTVTALSFIDNAGTLLVAVYGDPEEMSWLVRIDSSGATATVAELVCDLDAEECEGDARTYALACDDAHGVVWVAGGFGLFAFELPARMDSHAKH